MAKGSSPKQATLEWTRQKIRAMVALADGRKTDQQIADELDIGRRTLARWENDSAFAKRRNDLVERHARMLERLSHARLSQWYARVYRQ
jgi:hypothetical protein